MQDIADEKIYHLSKNRAAVVPPAYSWTAPQQIEGQEYPQAVQNMLWSRWLNLIQKEEASGTGHIGPLYT